MATKADAAVPATPDARGKAVAKFFAGLGGGWLAQGGKESNESFYPTELMEPFAPRGDQVKGTTGGAAAASEAARTTRPGKERAQPRGRVAQLEQRRGRRRERRRSRRLRRLLGGGGEVFDELSHEERGAVGRRREVGDLHLPPARWTPRDRRLGQGSRAA